MILYTPKIMPERYNGQQNVWLDHEGRRIKAFPINPTTYNLVELHRILKRHVQKHGAAIMIFNISPGKGTLLDDQFPLQREFTTITPYHIEEMRQLPLEGQERVISSISERILTASKTLLIDIPI